MGVWLIAIVDRGIATEIEKKINQFVSKNSLANMEDLRLRHVRVQCHDARLFLGRRLWLTACHAQLSTPARFDAPQTNEVFQLVSTGQTQVVSPFSLSVVCVRLCARSRHTPVAA